MALLYDENFQSYALGATPPFANLSGSGIIVNTTPGPYGDSQCLKQGSTQAVTYPILPTITLAQAQAGVTYASLGVPSYSAATVFQALFIDYYPAMNGQILTFNSNLSPFAGVAPAAVRILSDGTVAVTAPASSAASANQAISTYSLTPGKWYFFQTNISFSNDGTYVIVTITVAVNGVPVVTASWTTGQLLSGVPALYWNNLQVGTAGNGGYIDRLTIYSDVEIMPSFPHLGTPVARVTQGVIEIARPTVAPPPPPPGPPPGPPVPAPGGCAEQSKLSVMPGLSAAGTAPPSIPGQTNSLKSQL
jgi:hypothetical protein